MTGALEDANVVALEPRLTYATVTAVNDTAVTVEVRGRLGVISVPRRWVFTAGPLRVGMRVEFYFSYMQSIPGPAVDAEFRGSETAGDREGER